MSLKVPAMTGSSVVDSIECLKRGETWFVNIRSLVEVIGGSLEISDGLLTISIAGNRVLFNEGSPFGRMPDGSIWQMPMPIEAWGDEFYAEATSFVKLMNSISPAEIQFDPPNTAFSFLLPYHPELKEDRSRWALDLVVIDPGHGGKDPGAIGATGTKEKDLTLDVALRLNKFLRNKDVKTVMTRDSDKFIALSERTSIANKASGKLFISLHCNSAKQRKAQGMETYFLAPSKTERATEVALLENEAIRFEDTPDRYKALTEESYILMTMTQATFTLESELLAGLVQETVTKKVGIRDRGVDQAGFYVLIGASMPAILFEMAFISNKEEEKKLKDKKFRQKLAEEIGGAILKFLAEEEEGSRR